MLCHNCDAWHMPAPCKQVPRQCTQCGHYGHMEYFCPIKAISRNATTELHTPSEKREVNGGNDGEAKTETVSPGQLQLGKYILSLTSDVPTHSLKQNSSATSKAKQLVRHSTSTTKATSKNPSFDSSLAEYNHSRQTPAQQLPMRQTHSLPPPRRRHQSTSNMWINISGSTAAISLRMSARSTLMCSRAAPPVSGPGRRRHLGRSRRSLKSKWCRR